MADEDRVARHLVWFRNHPVFSVLIAGTIVLVAAEAAIGATSRLWTLAFGSDEAGLRIVDVRQVHDPWEASRLVRPTLPTLGDSSAWVTSGEDIDSVYASELGALRAGVRDSLQEVWFPHFALFPELALLDVVVRNVAPQSAVIKRVQITAELLGRPLRTIDCVPLRMTAAYHLVFDGSREQHTVSVPLTHRIAGNDAERFGILVAQANSEGGWFRLHTTLVYNSDKELELPAIRTLLGRGCGQLGGQVLSEPLRFP